MSAEVTIDTIRAETLLEALREVNRRYACVVLGSGCIAQGVEVLGTRRSATVADGARLHRGPRVNPITTRRNRK